MAVTTPSTPGISLRPPARVRRIELRWPVLVRPVRRVSPLGRSLLSSDLLKLARVARFAVALELPRRRPRFLLFPADVGLAGLGRSCLAFPGFHAFTLAPDLRV